MAEHTTVGERLRDLRRRAGDPTQKTVAARIGCGYRSMQNWETDAAKPRWKYAVALARFYGTTPTYILNGVDEDAPTRVELEVLDAKLDRVLGLVESLVTGAPVPPPDLRAIGESGRKRRRASDGTDHRLAVQESVF
jgi:DNA-binding XRE family transcriptional regulator